MSWGLPPYVSTSRWLKRLGSLPASFSWIMPLTGTELSAVAWVSLISSLLVLTYKFISLSPQAHHLGTNHLGTTIPALAALQPLAAPRPIRSPFVVPLSPVKPS